MRTSRVGKPHLNFLLVDERVVELINRDDVGRFHKRMSPSIGLVNLQNEIDESPPPNNKVPLGPPRNPLVDTVGNLWMLPWDVGMVDLSGSSAQCFPRGHAHHGTLHGHPGLHSPRRAVADGSQWEC